MTDLLPPNATELERAVDGLSARLDELEVPLRDLWNPQRCPLALLPWLAWTVGVETWKPDWPEQTKRRFVAEAFEVHREKGTVAAIRRVLDLIGAIYDYTEGPDGGLPRMTATVSILNSESILLDDIAEVSDALDRAKRATLHLTVEVLAGFMGRTYLAGGWGLAHVIDFGTAEGAQ